MTEVVAALIWDKEINERIAAEYGNTSFYTGDNG